MPVRFPNVRRPSRIDQFVTDRFRDLDEATYKKDKASEKFVPYAALERIWTDVRLEEFIDLFRPGFDRTQIPIVKENLLRTLSILVYISWPEWQSFGSTFLHHRNAKGDRDRLDDRIPYYDRDTLSTFLDLMWANRFLDERWIFFPIVLEEGQIQRFHRDWRLPFVNPQPIPIGSGGYGQVTKEIIASRQFVAYSALTRAPFQGEVPIARKRYASRQDFRREMNNLEFIRSSRSHHRHIVSYLSAVVVGSDYNLLLPLAEMDLEQFLDKEAQGQRLVDLISEARNVVGALGFLHGMLQTNHPGLACCHNDLKPANILVFQEPDSSPALTWKITDFGISVIAEPDEHPDTARTIREQPLRNASTYQAPEVCHSGDIGRRSDVWSMGCILVRILALGIDGQAGLKALDDARGQDADAQQDYEHDYFHRGSPPQLNPHIERWLNVLPSLDLPAEFCIESRSLLLSMLAIHRRDRPAAVTVFQRLNRISQLTPQSIRVTAQARIPRIVTPTSSPHSRGGNQSQQSTPLSSAPSQQPSPASEVVRAIQTGQMDDLSNLLSHGTNIDESHEGDRPLIHAVRRGNIAAVEMLQRHKPGPDVVTPSSDGQTPLAMAAAQGDPELVDLLLEMGAPINGTSGAGMTPLMCAARLGHVKAANTLLNQGAERQLYSSAGWSPLHYAIYGPGAGDLVALFIEHDVDVNIPTEFDKETPLLMLVKYRNTHQWWDKYETLLRGHANVNRLSAQGYSPLLIAIEDDVVELADDLINKRSAALPPNFSQIPKSSDMAKLLKRAAKSTGQRRDSALSWTTTRNSLSLSKSR